MVEYSISLFEVYVKKVSLQIFSSKYLNIIFSFHVFKEIRELFSSSQ